MPTTVSHNLAETATFAEAFARDRLSRLGERATILALYGDLGSGKTAFTQALAKTLGVAETVSSPTFVIQKRYQTTHLLFRTLIHIDAYRLRDGAELLHLRWEDIVRDPSCLIVIEWPERVADILPESTIKMCFKFLTENEREISL